jgi:hypothetical protein
LDYSQEEIRSGKQTMSSNTATNLTTAIYKAAGQAGLAVLSADQATDFNGQPTAAYKLGVSGSAPGERTLQLELSNVLDVEQPELFQALGTYLSEQALRLRNPQPDVYVTVGGIPITLGEFHWPFHRSTSGADTYIVHGLVSLADGTASPLHAKISASMTVTFAEIVPAAEQPYAETFIYNAIRKTLDQGQLELLKSGNRQPVPVTTRYYSRWQKKFFFSDSTEETRRQFILSKVFWLSGILGQSRPVWVADPRDAQYLNTTPEMLATAAAELARAGVLNQSEDGAFAAATPALLKREHEFRARLEESLAFTKPAFNEEMRAGHTNM